MLRTIGIFLMSLFLFSQGYNTAVWVHYELNVEEITDLFCENTDKPELNCHGSCHLEKQLIKKETSDSEQAPSIAYGQELELYFSSTDDLPGSEVVSTKHYTAYQGLRSQLDEVYIFHPPQV